MRVVGRRPTVLSVGLLSRLRRLVRVVTTELFLPRLIPASFKYRKQEKMVTLPNGKKAKITVDDSGTVAHREQDESLDATVRPKSIKVQIMGQER